MFQPVNFFIGLRYSQSRSRTGFISFITFFSIVGILLGVASLITVASVMNGFEGELKKRILGLVPHIIIKDEQTNSPLTLAQLTESLSDVAEIRKITPFEQSEALIQSASTMSGVLIQGVQANLEQNSIVQQNMVAGDLSVLDEEKYQVVIGRALARKLAVSLGDTVRLILPNRTIFTPMGRVPMQRTFTIGGIFNVGSQIDDGLIYLSYADSQKLMRKKAKAEQQFRLYLHDAFDVSKVAELINSRLPNTELSTWQQSQGALFSAVKMEKNMMWLMLSLIVAVAAFNIVSALVMVVNEKQGEISILQTMGMSRTGVLQIFITQGMVNGAWGVSLGAMLGLLLTFGLNPALELLGINIFGAGYISQSLPIQLAWQDVAIIVASAFCMSFIATLYPAYRAANTLPAEVLRNE